MVARTPIMLSGIEANIADITKQVQRLERNLQAYVSPEELTPAITGIMADLINLRSSYRRKRVGD